MSRLIHNLTNSPNLVERIKGIDRSIDTLNDKVGSIPEGMDVGQSIIDLQNNKQDLLIAGEGISIENNVISNTYSAEWGDISGDITDQTDLQDALDSISGSIPTNTSDLTNDSGFITNSVNDLINYYLKSETYTKTEVDNLIGSIQNFHYEIYPNLGSVTTPTTNVLYLIGPTGTGSDKYEEYVYSNNNFVKIGDTSIDLSGYVTTTDLNTALSNYTTTANLTTLLAQKQDALTAGAGISIINNVISNTIPGATISNTAPSNPTQGTLWYDTVNDVLKSYDGSIWSEVGNESVDINTKTFILSGTSDLTNAQAAYDWFSAGKNPIVMYNNRAYLIYAKNATQLIFQDIENSAYDQYSYTEYVGQKVIFTLSGNDVTAINYNSTSGWSGPILRTDIDYPTPYIPQYDGSPATKKYVDEHTGTTYTAGTNIQISAQNVISATDTTYTAGTGISIDANNVISNTQTSAEWGNITGDISDQIDLMNLIDTKQDLLTSENAGRDIEIINGPGGDATVTGNTSILLEDAIADGLNSVTVSGKIKQNYLPEGYTEYEYIHTSGKYFVTDYYPNNKTEVKTKIFMNGQPGSPLVTRWTTAPTNNTFGFYMGNVSNRLTFFYGAYGNSKYTNVEDTKTNIEHDIYMGVSSIVLDGTSYSTTRDIFTSTQPIYIGAFNQTGTSLAGTLTGRIYKIEFIENGNVVRRYIPCKNANNEIGLYETATGTFISSTGTGSLKTGKIAEKPDTLPSEYTRIEYLQSTGTQYIDTGIIGNFANNKIEQSAIVEYTTSGSDRELMGTNGYGFWGKSASDKIEAALGQMTVTDNALTKNKISWTTDPTDSNKLILNVNSNQYTSTASSLVDADYSYYIFALGIRIGSGGSASFLCKAKIYSYTISLDDEVVCDLVPCKRNSDNVLGMYDLVRGVFLTNAGTGTFTAGNNYSALNPSNPQPIISNNGELKAKHSSGLPLGYTKVEYIQSTGTQYINTGYVIPDLTNKYVVHLRMTVDGGTAQGTSSNNWGYMGQNSGMMLTYTRDNGLGTNTGGVPVIADRIYDITLIRNSDTSRSLVIDNTTFSILNQSTVYPDRPFGIFRLSPFNTEFNRIYGKIYEFQGYVNDVLVSNLIPCKRNSDNVLGMYDTIKGVFLTNAGTGTFTAGNNVTDNIEIYTEGITETVEDELGNTATAEMLLSIGDYTDTQEILTGIVIRKVGVIILDGTENWGLYATNNGYRSFRVNSFLSAYTKNGICTHLPYYDFSSSNMDRECVSIGSNKTTFFINLAGEGRTVDDLKAWLASQLAAGTPVMFIYPLATETTETVTSQTLTTIQGDNTLTITQASIDNLPIEANYDKIGGLTISFVNDDGFQTVANMKTDLNNPDDTHYPTTKAVSDAIQGAGGADIDVENQSLIITDGGGGGGGGGGIQDVLVDGTSVVSNNVANINLSGKQDVSNLVTSVSSSSTDSQYPSAKLFYNTCGDIETLINAL